ncbi:MAG: dihydrolipoyl dehydrogenase [Candidatus Marinimicrobia bacterium]|nr:dihydrolipoyl dehydrogenase [Candidatus Neomarinimicrobiota bacterium]
MEDIYDLTVIGGGPGGYVAAIRASQLGMRVIIVEKRPNLGGTCLNVGCIPSKALLHSSHLYNEARQGFSHHGIKATGVKLDLKTMMKHKNQVVGDTVKGIDYLMKKNNIDRLIGSGKIIRAGETRVISEKGKKEIIPSKNILIATGSKVTHLPGIEIDEERIFSSTGALELPKVPRSMVVIGAGAIGLEIGSIWRRLGAEVTVVEFMENILFGLDEEISKTMAKVLEKQGFNFALNSKVIGVIKSKAGVTLTIECRDSGKLKELNTNIVLVAIGRRPYTDDLGLENIGVKMDDSGFIKTDVKFKTNVDSVYAIGDVIGGAMLAHKAEDEGIVFAEMLAGQSGSIDYDMVPSIVYTWPEVARLGKSEEQLIETGIAYKVGKFTFSANPRARVRGDTTGFVKILAEAKTDAVLGVHILGAFAGELIQECVVAMEFGGSAEDIARISHGHPGLCEVVKEAALAVHDRAIHM